MKRAPSRRVGIQRKLPKLVNEYADRRVLLLEKADIACGITDARAAIDKIADEFPLVKTIDEIWLTITHCWDELCPELGGRRLKLEGFSTGSRES